MLYNLQFSEEENLSFGELRTFEDSYNLAEPEPEPVLDPVILNFIPVPAEVEPEMADPAERLFCTLIPNRHPWFRILEHKT